MYGPEDLPPVVLSNAERETDHPLMRAWLDTRVYQSFSREEVRDIVDPAYMGLIKQLDDEMGRQLDYLEETGRMDDTMIVFSSDHGDNMGDHWLGGKDLFYDCSARIPLIVYDPRAQADGRWKSTHVEGFAPLLYDLETDADELIDRAGNPDCADHLQRLSDALFHWSRQHHTRTTVTAADMDRRAKGKEPPGIYIGFWDEAELVAAGKKLPDNAAG